MLRSQIEALVESIRNELSLLHQSIKEHEGTTRDAHTADQKAWEAIPRQIVSGLSVPNDERAKADTYRKQAHRQQKWLIWGTWLAFIAASIYAGIAALQLDELRSASEAAHQQVVESRKLLEADLSHFDRTMTQMQAQTAAQIESAKAAENAVNATQTQMRLDERAWMGSSDVTFTLNETEPIRVQGVATNVGKTPAVDIHSDIASIFFPRSHVLSPTDFRYPRPQTSNGTLFPNQRFTIKGWNTAVLPYQKAVISGVKDGGLVMYVFGEITYRDVFHHAHWIHFCVAARPNLSESGSCEIYNDSDADYTD